MNKGQTKNKTELKRNIAIIGCGHWGKNLIRNFYQLKSLHTICDIEEDRLNYFKDKYKDIKITNDYKNILKDPKIKALVIATPAATHHSICKEAILANKDVFVEKPIALHYEEGEELISLAEKNDKVLMVGHILEYHPAILKLKELINNGELGKINYIYSNRLNLGKFRTEENILWSFAPHDISAIINLLQEMPEEVSAQGGNYLNPNIADVTITTMRFPSGVKSHIFVSWLHPYKEQKLVVVGTKKMALFDDVNPSEKLYIYNHKIDWIERFPIPTLKDAKPVKIKNEEPLKLECEHFIECIKQRKKPRTDGIDGVKVLKILEACQYSMENNGVAYSLIKETDRQYYIHESSFVDESVKIGEGTKIWHFSHILKNTKIGKNCNIGQNVMIGPNVEIGNNVKIQNNVSVYEGVTLRDDVFCGPSMVFTNVINPRSHWPRKNEYKKTLVKKGATLGANSTIICGVTIGQYAFVGAGALVNKDVPDYTLVYGVPAKIRGWMCYCGAKLDLSNQINSQILIKCTNCGRKYKKTSLNLYEIQ